ncbi:hypothetical protein WMY93_020706 [Mugilogobius chulae]|uniref:Uncharacterized protein n=1 Tax=Mugilogobius chulae TaxID=88201 RepID=A0AAW0NEF3_9GOBI
MSYRERERERVRKERERREEERERERKRERKKERERGKKERRERERGKKERVRKEREREERNRESEERKREREERKRESEERKREREERKKEREREERKREKERREEKRERERRRERVERKKERGKKEREERKERERKEREEIKEREREERKRERERERERRKKRERDKKGIERERNRREKEREKKEGEKGKRGGPLKPKPDALILFCSSAAAQVFHLPPSPAHFALTVDLLTTSTGKELENPCLLPDDVTEPSLTDKTQKSVTFLESVSFITDTPATMELQSQQIQHGRLSTSHSLKEAPEGELVQEICFLDQVLDAASDVPTNGDSADQSRLARSPVNHEEHGPAQTNGHAPPDDYGKPKFELRAFHEEKKPSKLFSPADEPPVRVTRRRPTEEVQELERERQELIKDQAVKKNPGIATRCGTRLRSHSCPLAPSAPPTTTNHLHSHQVCGPPTAVTFDPQLARKDDIVEEQIDFSSARKQFLQDNKKDVAPQIYSAKPFSKPRSSHGDATTTEIAESHVTWSDEGIGGDFTCARAVMTILPEDDDAKAQFQSSFLPEESDSGLDDLSLRSQDTTLCSLDNVSDSGASLPPTPQPLTPLSPPTPQPDTPTTDQNGSGPSEDELDYHAAVMVENAIQNALAAQNGNHWSCSDSSAPASPKPPSSSGSASPSNSQSSQIPESRSEKLQTPSPPASLPVSPPARAKNGGPRIKIQSSYARALAASTPAAPPPPPQEAPVPRPTPVYRPPSPPSPDKPEFSYFTPDTEAASGPFRLVQETTNPVHDRRGDQSGSGERAGAEEAEGEPACAGEGRSGGGGGLEPRRSNVPPADKMKSNSLPTRLTLTAKTAPGKIEKVRPAAPVSPAASEGTLSDAGSEDSTGSSKPKNFMQTLMEDYETHKVKRREQMEDSQYARLLLASKVTHEVLEATRVTRRKSDMAVRWEAGIYTKEEGQEDYEEEEEEEEEEE